MILMARSSRKAKGLVGLSGLKVEDPRSRRLVARYVARAEGVGGWQGESRGLLSHFRRLPTAHTLPMTRRLPSSRLHCGEISLTEERGRVGKLQLHSYVNREESTVWVFATELICPQIRTASGNLPTGPIPYNLSSEQACFSPAGWLHWASR